MPRPRETSDDVRAKILALESDIVSEFGDLRNAQSLYNEYIRDKNTNAKAAYLKHNKLSKLRSKYDTLSFQERRAEQQQQQQQQQPVDLSPLIDALHIGNNDGDGDIQMVELHVRGDDNDNDDESNESKLFL